MTWTLRAFVTDELSRPVQLEIAKAAEAIAKHLGGVAVIFYGSVLRTGDLDAVLDFYVLTESNRGRGLRAIGTRWLWPDVSFEEVMVGCRTIRSKVATMPLQTFTRAAQGRSLDTTIWARFAQPVVLIWASDERVRRAVIDAIAAATVTAARFAAVLGPRSAEPRDFWKQLFQETYTAELRVERPGRGEQILAFDYNRYDELLPHAWRAGGIEYRRDGRELTPVLSRRVCQETCEAWLIRQRLGKILNLARLVKASFTFEGAARYAAWKLQRHTGVPVALTPWQERHPILAAPSVVLRVWHSTKGA